MKIPMQHLDSLYIFIMAGGGGERFWPMSRCRLPKHLLRLFGKCSLLERTVARIRGIIPSERTFILTSQTQLEAVRSQLPSFRSSHVIAEPVKRDTAPAAALATAIAHSKNPNTIVALLPADAMIHSVGTFRRQLIDAVTVAARQPCIVVFSVLPTHPATGLGYLELGPQLPHSTPNGSAVYCVQRFIEKPDRQTAQAYLRQGSFGWNAGICIWKSECFLQECMKSCQPLADFILQFPAGNPNSYISEYFSRLPKNSLDYAILEQASSVLVAIRSQFDWDDMGTWTSLTKYLGRDTQENSFQGPTALFNSRENIVIASHRTVALCGIQNLIVVETPDAILICHRDSVQDVKKVLPLLSDSLR
ncbi:Mannose-1-phosphate guanylyltransferase RfbM [Candidatus Xiphinematobacter sp. Idaho Grape]|uniref:mannose-1-phosphate guanylyltransferase n=1 Tax=Candidatus Xiphinematobacter sp. Idaho Grape TaxID=1704307 RepID=UPI000705CB43|nr:sugar phosphate nucleotidyltransferase [Candidatus Xiphinematobacter sp. Idaho Grape]ALJ56554.1 Mannose-1-phosphate guanylyltransferase RfbM [Candidatus Xiphinematobacter sp. Idaho Grape]